MKNLPVVFFIPMLGIKILILVFSNKILVLFNRSIRIPRAHARTHKVFYPCNRCHLATLLENQRVTCGNEVTRVTRKGDFPIGFIQHRATEAQSFYYFSMFIKILHGGCEALGSVGRRYGLQNTTMGIMDEDPIMLNCNPTWFAM